MFADIPNTIDPAASHRSGHGHVFTEQLLDQLADDLVTLNSEGGATREALLQRGWEPHYLDINLAEAQTRANRRFIRALDDAPVRSLLEVENDMAGVIASLLPSTRLLIAELQSRGFSKRHIDLLLNKSRGRAAYDFCLGQAGEAH